MVLSSLLVAKNMTNLVPSLAEGYDVTVPPQMVFSPSLQVNGNCSPILASVLLFLKDFESPIFFFFSFQYEDFTSELSSQAAVTF